MSFCLFCMPCGPKLGSRHQGDGWYLSLNRREDTITLWVGQRAHNKELFRGALSHWTIHDDSPNTIYSGV